jgi:hypothetical protein
MKQSTKQVAKVSKSASVQSKLAPTKGKERIKKTEKFTFLVEGVNGKELQNSKIETNRAVKTEIRSFSFAKKYALEFDKGFFTKFAKFNPADLTPANLLPLRSDREKEQSDKGGFSSWLFMSLVKRFYAQK